jgi:hypothetical protein
MGLWMRLLASIKFRALPKDLGPRQELDSVALVPT